MVTGHLCSDEPATREAWRQKCEKEGGRVTDWQRGRPWNHDRAIVGRRRGGVKEGGRYVFIAREWLKGLPKCHASIAKGVQSHALSKGRFGASVDNSGGDDAVAAAPARPPMPRTTKMVIPRRK